jgi:hypothetical protein
MDDPNVLIDANKNQNSNNTVIVNSGFINFGLDKGEFQAVPPQKFTIDYNQDRLIVNNKIDPTDFKNGIYQASESSAFGKSNGQPWWRAIRIFDGETQAGWYSPWYAGERWKYMMNGYTQHPYRTTKIGGKGEYHGGGTKHTYYETHLSNGKKIAGEWAQIKLPYNLKLTRYSIMAPRNKMPSKFSILGSTTGKTWVVLDNQNIVDPASAYDLSKAVEFKIQNQPHSYNYFRIVIERVGHHPKTGDCIAVLNQFNLFGTYCMGLASSCENFETYSKMPRIEGLTTMEAESQLLADLMDFNNKYANYVQCTDPALITNGNNVQGQTCSTTDKDINTVNNAYNKLLTYTTSNRTNTLTGGDIYTLLNTHLTNPVSNEQYDASFNYIKQTYNNDIIKLRNELDTKMKELYLTPDSRMYEYKNTYDSSIYTGILWTVLATTGLYFVFTKL